MNVLKVNCNVRISSWLSQQYPELDEKSAESDLPISGNYDHIDLVLVGSLNTNPIDLAKSLSDWPSAPPSIFIKDPDALPEFVDKLSYTPGIGRNILACKLEEEDFNRVLQRAVEICTKRRELGIGAKDELVPINQNMSPSWLFQLMLKELPEYIYFKDTSGRFIALSEYTANRSGWADARQAIGLTDYDLFDREHADEAAIDEGMLVRGEVDRIEKEEFVTWKGNEIWVHSVKRPILSQSGYPLGIFGISRDITAQKRLSEQLESQHRHLADELTLARSLQESLLTKGVPDFRDANDSLLLDFSAKHIPSSQLSGDFYSVIRTPSGKAAVFLADVMGHGASAAMVTAMLYAAVNEKRHLSDSPVAFMQEINNMLYAWLGERGHVIFATGIFCLIDLEANQGEICLNGGTHALIPSQPESPMPVNPALGLMPEDGFSSATFPIRQGDRIVFFTDGILEATNPEGEAFGIDRIDHSIKTSQGATLDDKLESLTQELQRFTGKDQEEDDICLLIAELV